LASGSLKTFLDATKDSTPEERAAKLEGNGDICGVHDTVAKEGQTAEPSLDDKVIHFQKANNDITFLSLSHYQ